MKSVELFAGAGGLGLGTALAGFEHVAVVEWDRWACDTIRENQQRGFPLVSRWNLAENDVRVHDFSTLPEGLDLVAGGPPCQPFSISGKHRAHDDERDMFPAVVDVIQNLKPRAFLIENVKGLTRSTFANYYQYILLQLEFPEVRRLEREDWRGHYQRLQAEKTSGQLHASGYLAYNVVPTVLNAANYGVPQKRERVFIIGFRDDLGIEWSFPTETHALDSLLYQQWISGEYWDRHKIAGRDRPEIDKAFQPRVARLRGMGKPIFQLPWRTTRDALVDLPDPETTPHSAFNNHRFQAGARRYPGHTGSALDLPAKTLKAGDHGVPGGENMMIRDNGDVRYFTVREAARLQTFPDGYVFHGSWTETMRQLGNAVPVSLAQVVAASVAERLLESEMKDLESTYLGVQA